MGLLSRALVAFSLLGTLVAAQNISTYLPSCAPPCIEDTVRNTTVCEGVSENTCLCRRMQDVEQQSSRCFFMNCRSMGSPPDTRNQVLTGWQKFCADVQGTSNGTSTPSVAPSSSGSTSVTSSVASTSTPAPAVTAATSGLSTGARAGIGVGAGVGGLLAIGSLVFLGFRLGRQRRGNAPGSIDDQETGAAKDDDKAAAEVMGFTTQLDGNAVSELQTDNGIEDLRPVKELEAWERPVELWHADKVGIIVPGVSSSESTSEPYSRLWIDGYDTSTSGMNVPQVYELPANPTAESPVRVI